MLLSTLVDQLAMWALSLLGFGLLCFAKPRHRKALNLRPLSNQRETLLIRLGLLSITVALVIALLMPGHWADGLVLWVGVITFAALFYVVILSAKQLSRS